MFASTLTLESLLANMDWVPGRQEALETHSGLGHERRNSELCVRDIPNLDRALEQEEPGDFLKLKKTLNQECGERNRRNISM